MHGASGGVGVAAVHIARAMGMTVIGTAGTDKGLELVRSVGAHHAFNHKQASAYTNQGYALEHLQRYEEALAADVQASHLDPTSDHAYRHMGLMLERILQRVALAMWLRRV